METAAEVVTRAALREPSYAGAFAFESQAPMKTFAGETPCVPLPTVVEALSATGRPSANVETETLREVIGMDVASCAAACTPPLVECMLGRNPNRSLAARMADPGVQSCVAHAKNCHTACAKQRREPSGLR